MSITERSEVMPAGPMWPSGMSECEWSEPRGGSGATRSDRRAGVVMLGAGRSAASPKATIRRALDIALTQLHFRDSRNEWFRCTLPNARVFQRDPACLTCFDPGRKGDRFSDFGLIASFARRHFHQLRNHDSSTKQPYSRSSKVSRLLAPNGFLRLTLGAPIRA